MYSSVSFVRNMAKIIDELRTTGFSFYSVPHFQENAYHLHNDNFIPVSSNILSTPCLCDGVTLSSCNRHEKVKL